MGERPIYFKAVHVFDIAQTDGEPLPELARVAGDPGEKLRSGSASSRPSRSPSSSARQRSWKRAPRRATTSSSTREIARRLEPHWIASRRLQPPLSRHCRSTARRMRSLPDDQTWPPGAPPLRLAGAAAHWAGHGRREAEMGACRSRSSRKDRRIEGPPRRGCALLRRRQGTGTRPEETEFSETAKVHLA